jgi:hypothetical protein
LPKDPFKGRLIFVFILLAVVVILCSEAEHNSDMHNYCWFPSLLLSDIKSCRETRTQFLLLLALTCALKHNVPAICTPRYGTVHSWTLDKIFRFIALVTIMCSERNMQMLCITRYGLISPMKFHKIPPAVEHVVDMRN